MAKQHIKPVDRTFLGIVLALLTVGIFIFVSASLGILVKNEAKFYSIVFNQVVLGLVLGLIGLFFASRIPHTFWRKNAFYIFIATIIAMVLVFVPGLGYEHGGARRWVDVFGLFSFQPAELLKIGFLIYFAGWLSWAKQRVADLRFSILPLVILLGICAGLLFVQPDTKSFVLMLGAGGAMLFVSGVPWKYILGVVLLGIVGVGILAMTNGYIRDRLTTFVDPSSDPQGASYQLQQSLIAIGSGGVTGKGFGQSVQKFSYLPEPQGDSVFAVAGEEFGFIGGVVILMLYLGFMFRGFRIANRAPDLFGRLLTVGIISLITFQAFMNIASITGVIPLTGVPLPFVSHGGTSLMITLFAVGIVLSVSRHQKEPQ